MFEIEFKKNCPVEYLIFYIFESTILHISRICKAPGRTLFLKWGPIVLNCELVYCYVTAPTWKKFPRHFVACLKPEKLGPITTLCL